MHYDKFFIKKIVTSFLFTGVFISICSLAYSFQVTLAWDPNPEPDLAGYKAYYGTISRNYEYSADVGKYESVTISGLKMGEIYYFAVTAYDDNGNESNFSNEIFYQVPVQKSMPWIPLLLDD